MRKRKNDKQNAVGIPLDDIGTFEIKKVEEELLVAK